MINGKYYMLHIFQLFIQVLEKICHCMVFVYISVCLQTVEDTASYHTVVLLIQFSSLYKP